METAIELENMQIEIARKILSKDISIDILKKISDYLQSLLKTDEDYYESEQFYKEIEEARQQVKNGQCKEINSKEDLDKLILG